MSHPPTLDELRKAYQASKERVSRFHKSPCPKCGAMVTNQAMGRAAHMRMHKRKETERLSAFVGESSHGA